MGKKNNSATAEFISTSIGSGAFGSRLVGYVILYIILMVFMALGDVKITWLFFIPKLFGNTVGLIASLLFMAIPFFILEWIVRATRRAKGLSVYGDVSADLEQMKIDEAVAKEHKAYVNNGIIKDSVDKNDIGYWFSLFEKGAITKDEYEAKKKELL